MDIYGTVKAVLVEEFGVHVDLMCGDSFLLHGDDLNATFDWDTIGMAILEMGRLVASRDVKAFVDGPTNATLAVWAGGAYPYLLQYEEG